MNKKEIFEEAIKQYGGTSQITVAIEEMAELTKELVKHLRYGDSHPRAQIIEEIADVEIMLEQLVMLFKFTRLGVDNYKAQKLERLATRLGVAFSE